MDLTCPQCGRSWPVQGGAWRCSCGAPLEWEPPAALDPTPPTGAPANLWRYAGALPPVPSDQRVSLGETLTPLVAETWHGLPVLFKLDYLFPTGSYKDRANAVFVSALRAAGIRRVVEDSSGNAGASLAAYAARARMACTIYLPADTSPAKLLQIAAYGAEIVKVPGPRAEAARAVQEAARTQVYASHNWHPFFLHGMKSLAFEIWEQLGRRAPARMVVPTGYGSLLLGCYLGFRDLLRAGLIRQLPRLYAVQAAACAPLYRAIHGRGMPAGGAPTPPALATPAPAVAHSASTPAAACGPTLAEGIACAEPVRMPQLIQALRESDGDVLAVSEEEIKTGLRELAARGLYVEPTAAVVAAALTRLAAAGDSAPAGPTVAVLTGTGLKATEKLVQLQVF